jgi:hypothetical protein
LKEFSFFVLFYRDFGAFFRQKVPCFLVFLFNRAFFSAAGGFALKWPCAGTPDHWFRELCIAECRAGKNAEDRDDSLREMPALIRRRNPEINA